MADADAAAAVAAAAVNAARDAEFAARDQEAEEAADRLDLQFAEDIAARSALRSQARLAVTKAIPPLNEEIIKYFCTPAGRDVLHQATQSHPIGKSLPPDLQEELMVSSEPMAMELRRSARDLRALLSPSSRVLSVIAPLRGKTTFTEVRQELEEVYQMVMSTCKDTLRSIYLGCTKNYEQEIFDDPKEPDKYYESVLQEFLHRLLTSLEDVTVLKVDFLDSVVNHETLQILATRHKNLKCLRVAYSEELLYYPFTGEELRTLTSGCPKIQVLDFNYMPNEGTFEPSPEEVVHYLQDLPDLQTLSINKQEGLLLYASDPSNPPRPVQCQLELYADQEDHWGGEKFDRLIATFPNHEKLNLSPMTDSYSDSLSSRVDSLDHVWCVSVGGQEWSLQSQARFFKKFATSLTDIYLFSGGSVVWGVDLGVIGKNCVEVSTLSVEKADFTFSKLETGCFQKLEWLDLEGFPNQKTHPPDSFVKIMLSGSKLSRVDLVNVQVSDQALLDLSQSAKERRGGVFASLHTLKLRGLCWPGLRAATLVNVVCQAPRLYWTRFSVGTSYGIEGPMEEGLVVCKFFERHNISSKG